MEDLMILCETCHSKHHRDQKFKNGRKSKYMKDPNYDTTPVTYYPKRTISTGLCHMLRCFKEEITAVKPSIEPNITEAEFKKLFRILYPKDNSKKFRR